MSGFFITVPFLGSGNIPVTVRAGAVFMIALLIFPTLDLTGFVPPAGAVRFAFVIATEVLFGVIIGFLAMLAFEGFRLAGEIFGVQLGFGMITVIDPSSEIEESLMDVVNYMFVILIFLAVEGHHQFLLAMRRSFDIIPPGKMIFNKAIVGPVISMSSDLFLISIQIAFPLIAAILVVTVILGIVSRAVPRMEVFMLSFPLKIVLGLLFMAWLLPWVAHYAIWLIERLVAFVYRVIPLFGGA